MPEDRTDPLADLFTLLVTPLSGTVRSLEQFRKGVDEFLKGVENFNRTMANLNETTERINGLLADVEEPIRAAIPQVTRTVKAADEMMQVVSGPAMAVAPGLHRLAETLSTPAFAQLPAQISLFSDVLSEVSTRLSPLTQMAEAAGGLFGGLRVPGMRTTTSTTRFTPAPHRPTADPERAAPERTAPATKPTVASKATTQRTATTAPAKKQAAKRQAAKKSAARKTTAKKTTATTSAARRSAAGG
jgi:hypothetical protein